MQFLAGSDYTAIAMRVTFAPGTTTQTLALTTLEDSITEQPETLTATLSSPVGASLATAPTATITITEDDGNYFFEYNNRGIGS